MCLCVCVFVVLFVPVYFAAAAVCLCVCCAVVGSASSSRLSSKLSGGGGSLEPDSGSDVAAVTENFYSSPVGNDETTLRDEFATLTAEAAQMEAGSAKHTATLARLLLVAGRIVELTSPQAQPVQIKQVQAVRATDDTAAATETPVEDTPAPAPAAAPVTKHVQHGDQPPLDFDPWADETSQPVAMGMSFLSLEEDAPALLESYADSEFAAAASKCTARGGVCKRTSLGCSGGAFASGLCAGSASVRCCIKKKAATHTASSIPNSSACAARNGHCRHTSSGCGGSFISGLCAGAADIRCCAPHSSSSGGSSSYSPGPVYSGSCGPLYAHVPSVMLTGNGGVRFPVIPINRAHLSDPSIYGWSTTAADNHILTTTACAFEAMHDAARAQGVNILINSGFRTLARQQYFCKAHAIAINRLASRAQLRRHR